MNIESNPFGQSITVTDIIDTLSFFDSWEERYKYIIDLGKELPALEEQYKTDENIVRGCQSQVWIIHRCVDNKLYFFTDSDAFIVKGLLGLVMAAYNAKTPAEILSFDIDAYFEELALLKHLSPTRGNGIRAMVDTILALAKTSS